MYTRTIFVLFIIVRFDNLQIQKKNKSENKFEWESNLSQFVWDQNHQINKIQSLEHNFANTIGESLKTDLRNEASKVGQRIARAKTAKQMKNDGKTAVTKP